MRVLDNLNLDIRPCEVLALVGPSGGGKSSIVKLLERLYEPTHGSVSLDGVDLENVDMQWYRKQITMVSQDPVMYARSIKENIVYGLDEKEYDHESIVEACKQANAHDFIMSFPEQYDTDIGERGIQLSGGQRQRLAIARALVRNPKILLLDEATSALDAESEAIVQEALDRVINEKQRTVVVIAHRLSTIQSADRVVVIEDGAVAEQGAHEELLQLGGTYAHLVRRQIEGLKHAEQE